MLRLTVEELSKRYAARRVLSGISFEARSGHTLVITGPNGVGKSTLLRCLVGLARPTSGSVSWFEEDGAWGASEHRTRLGFLSPELALYEELTGGENLSFFARLRGRDQDRAEAAHLLGRVGLAGREGDRVSDYSSGMKQRLKWAFALMGDPAALVLDEPGVTLDADGFALACSLVREARDRGALVVVATNDTREVELGDDHLVLG
jgi:heme exporter protein A